MLPQWPGGCAPEPTPASYPHAKPLIRPGSIGGAASGWPASSPREFHPIRKCGLGPAITTVAPAPLRALASQQTWGQTWDSPPVLSRILLFQRCSHLGRRTPGPPTSRLYVWPLSLPSPRRGRDWGDRVPGLQGRPGLLSRVACPGRGFECTNCKGTGRILVSIG